MSLPAEVQQTTGTFLALIDEAAPDLIEGLYLHGSLGFGEFYADRSDIDFVAVLSARPSEAGLDALAAAHAKLSQRHPRPFFDGFHILREDLARSPFDCPDVPCNQAGTFKSAGRFDINPVTWHELAWHGITVRGADLNETDVWTNEGALRAFTHSNLTDYWAGWSISLPQTRRAPPAPRLPSGACWA